VAQDAHKKNANAVFAGRFVPGGWVNVRSSRRITPQARWRWLAAAAIHVRRDFSCASRVLFLDERPEWDRRVLEVLREPLETGVIHISRAARQRSLPTQFQLIAAMNPYFGIAKFRLRA
jgi:hypothetical protein